jgi:hypothetical protein
MSILDPFFPYFAPLLHLDWHTQTIDGKVGGSFCYKIKVLYFSKEENHGVYLY